MMYILYAVIQLLSSYTRGHINLVYNLKYFCFLLFLQIVILGNIHLVIHMERSSKSGLQTFREHGLVTFSTVELQFDLSVTCLRECKTRSRMRFQVGKLN